MSANVICLAWRQSLPGRESISAQHFEEFLGYLQKLKDQGVVESFEPVLLEPNGDVLGGFFLIKGEPQKLAALAGSPEWVQHHIRATLHMGGIAILRGVTGAAVGDRMKTWINAIPR